ncbi:MAG: hypothetical protein DRR11_06870 [Gammaproteobacteria bacterium]|nr:MAG: hypothetical protein DRR15_17225 [Gammaproteobacteria bacterium]RLA32947.1 MAG: hypothetical protein DRR11_06870 [Gammaproteobacteria bacterium]
MTGDLMKVICKILLLFLFLPLGVVHGQDRDAVKQHLLGAWKMEPRILRSPGLVSYQEDATLTFTAVLPDGRLQVITRVTTRSVADTENQFTRPGCVGKKECIYDGATEGLCAVFGQSLYIDWIDPGWIDDFFKLSGNELTGDDGNGPIRFIKVE